MATPRQDLPPNIVLAFMSRPDGPARLRRALAIVLEAAAQGNPSPIAGTHPAVADQALSEGDH